MARSFREAEEASNAAYYLQQAGADQRTIDSLKYAAPEDIQAALNAAQAKQDADAALLQITLLKQLKQKQMLKKQHALQLRRKTV